MRTNEDRVVAAVALFGTITRSSPEVTDYSIRRQQVARLLYDSFLGGSTNGGASFALNKKLTSVMSNPDNDGFGGGFMGDYTGNTIAGATLYASWMDMRNGSFSQDFVGGYKVH